MKCIPALTSVIVAGILAATGAAQTAQPNSSQQEANRIRDEQQARQAAVEARRREENRQIEYKRLESVPLTQTGVTKRESLLPVPVKLNKEQKKRLAPDERDFAAYAQFLTQPNTGLLKIFPDAGCEENAHILRADDLCLNSIPNSAFYSFRRNRHTAEALSDIRYKDGVFISDGILSQGIMTVLGDVPLENISLASEGMKFLTDYKPEPQSREALTQFAKITRGVKAGEYIYRNAQPAIENTTYTLRVIAYRAKLYQPFNGHLLDVLEGDKRTDLTLAFRVVRKDADGSLLLLWKELARRESPKAVFPKGNKNNPIKPKT